MTHKYFTQVRTIPSFHEDQSTVAKSMRKISYTAKSAATYVINNKKTRVIGSVLVIYTLITSGFMVGLVNVNSNTAKADNANNNLSMIIKDQKVNGKKISMNLEVENKTSTTVTKPSFQIKSTNEKVNWQELINFQSNLVSTMSSSVINGEDLKAGQKTMFSLQGELTDDNMKNLVVSVKSNSDSVESFSPKYFVNIK